MRALDDMVRAGKILYIGISDAPAWVVSRANTMAELRGWNRFVALQVQYSLIERTVERDLLPMAKELDIAVTAWAPLGSGVLTGKYKRDQQAEEGRFSSEREWGKSLLTDRNFTIAETVAEVAKEVDRTPSQVAVNWVRQRRQNVIPIVGTRKPSQIQDNLAAVDFTLSDEQLARLDKVSAISLGFPHEFLASPPIRQVVLGNKADLIDNHRK